jgi:hypothetical protein
VRSLRLKDKLLEFVRRLEDAGIRYSLSSIREGAVMVEAFVPGQHREIEFFTDGHVEIERFFADPAGVHDDESLLDELIERNRD